MIHPHTTQRWVDSVVGYGMFATALIPRGTITWVLDDLDQVLTPEHVESLRPAARAILRRWGFVDGECHTVLAWDQARFVNHSCEPNTLSGGDDRFEIAVRDIHPGEQLTDDYGEWDMLDEHFPCRCGSPRCRGEVRTLPSRGPNPPRERMLAQALAEALGVPQPLAGMARGELPLPLASLTAVATV